MICADGNVFKHRICAVYVQFWVCNVMLGRAACASTRRVSWKNKQVQEHEDLRPEPLSYHVVSTAALRRSVPGPEFIVVSCAVVGGGENQSISI